jgi:hypothetical protein
MTYRVTMTATRPDTSVPFFYDSPDHAEQMAVVDAIKQEMEIVEGVIESYSKTYSEDNLTCIQTWEFGNISYWQQYMTSINTRLPRGIINRNIYFLDHGHKLTFTWIDDNGVEGSVVQVA